VKDNNIKNTCETLFHNPEMAFFNLTALGPQSVYKSLLKNRSLLHIFDEEDIQKAFDQIQLEGSSRQRTCYRFLRIFFTVFDSLSVSCVCVSFTSSLEHPNYTKEKFPDKTYQNFLVYYIMEHIQNVMLQLY
jgi:hypothetical protein